MNVPYGVVEVLLIWPPIGFLYTARSSRWEKLVDGPYVAERGSDVLAISAKNVIGN